jgi:phytoene synthase
MRTDQSAGFKEWDDYKTLPAFSDAYVSVMFLSEEARSVLRSLFHLDFLLQKTLHSVSDASLGVGKHIFWQEELTRFVTQTGTARHPLTRYFETLPMLRSVDFNPWLEKEALLLEQTRFLDFKQLDVYLSIKSECWQSWMSAYWLSSPESLPRLHIDIRPLAKVLELMRIMCEVRKDAREGRIFVPVNQLQKFEVKAAYLLNFQPHTNFSHLLIDWALWVEKEKKSALSTLTQQQKYEIRPFLILFQIMAIRFKRVLNLGDSILGSSSKIDQQLELWPICSMWEAWKTWVFSYRVR